MATTLSAEETEMSSSTLDQIRLPNEQESQTADWDEIRMARYLHDLWEFTSVPDVVVQSGETRYLIESKFAERSSSSVTSLSEITIKDAFRQNLMFFFDTKWEETPGLISPLREKFMEKVTQLRLRSAFTEFLYSETKKPLIGKPSAPRGSPQAVLQAIDALPHPTHEDVDDLMRTIRESEQSSRFDGLIEKP